MQLKDESPIQVSVPGYCPEELLLDVHILDS